MSYIGGGSLEYRRFSFSLCVGAHTVSNIENTVDIGPVELADPQDVVAGKFHSASFSSRIELCAWALILNLSTADT